jgi:hypothetical protein
LGLVHAILEENFDMTEQWGVAGCFWTVLVATSALSGCGADDAEAQKASVISSRAQETADHGVFSPDASMSLIDEMAGWAGMNDASHVSVKVVRGDTSLESMPDRNALAVRDDGAVEFRFEATSEAEGKELFGFFAQVVLHGVDDAEQTACVDVERSPS